MNLRELLCCQLDSYEGNNRGELLIPFVLGKVPKENQLQIMCNIEENYNHHFWQLQAPNTKEKQITNLDPFYFMNRELINGILK